MLQQSAHCCRKISYKRSPLNLRFLIFKAVCKIFKAVGFFYKRKSYAEPPKLIELETPRLKHRVGKYHQESQLESSLFLPLSCLWGTCLRSIPRHRVTTIGRDFLEACLQLWLWTKICGFPSYTHPSVTSVARAGVLVPSCSHWSLSAHTCDSPKILEGWC